MISNSSQVNNLLVESLLLLDLLVSLGRIPFAFLEDIHARFMKTYGGVCDSACASAMNDDFSRILRQQMEHYSRDPLADKINRIKEEISQVGLKCFFIIQITH